MKNISKFLQKGTTGGDDGRPVGEMKMITHEVDLEYVLKSVTESLKTDEATYENNIERIEKVIFLYFSDKTNPQFIVIGIGQNIR